MTPKLLVSKFEFLHHNQFWSGGGGGGSAICIQYQSWDGQFILL